MVCEDLTIMVCEDLTIPANPSSWL